MGDLAAQLRVRKGSTHSGMAGGDQAKCTRPHDSFRGRTLQSSCAWTINPSVFAVDSDEFRHTDDCSLLLFFHVRIGPWRTKKEEHATTKPLAPAVSRASWRLSGSPSPPFPPPTLIGKRSR